MSSTSSPESAPTPGPTPGAPQTRSPRPGPPKPGPRQSGASHTGAPKSRPANSRGHRPASPGQKKSPFGPWAGIIGSLVAAVFGGWLVLPGVGPDVLDLGGSSNPASAETSGSRADSPGASTSSDGGVLEGGEATMSPMEAEARSQLAELEVRPKAYVEGYDRSEFGPAWEDVDGNGCDTRNDVLARDLDNIRYRKGSRCVIQTGTLHDPYVGVTMPFQRGDATSPLVQIDHVVALGDAWRAGAWEWSTAERVRFANDPENLLAVEGQANQDKEASRADQWMPPNRDYHCEYVARQIAVKHAWGLSVIESERQAMLDALDTCP
ncbi:HNH endonuclease family protein [Schaalia canis]|nr:HNH endonuclease family protein [Schaalia canis]